MSTDRATTGESRPVPVPAGDGNPPGFTRLVKELGDLDYEFTVSDNPNNPAYTITDGAVRVVLDTTVKPTRAVVAKMSGDADPEWEITFTNTTPDPMQLMILYAALNADGDGGAGAAIEAAASALGVEPWGAGTKPVTSGD